MYSEPMVNGKDTNCMKRDAQDITPEMIQAGADEFWKWDAEYGYSNEYPIFSVTGAKELVTKILSSAGLQPPSEPHQD